MFMHVASLYRWLLCFHKRPQKIKGSYKYRDILVLLQHFIFDIEILHFLHVKYHLKKYTNLMLKYNQLTMFKYNLQIQATVEFFFKSFLVFKWIASTFTQFLFAQSTRYLMLISLCWIKHLHENTILWITYIKGITQVYKIEM